MVSEKKIFEIVDGRTDDGRTPDHGHPISSPCEPNGLGELKSVCKIILGITPKKRRYILGITPKKRRYIYLCILTNAHWGPEEIGGLLVHPGRVFYM